MAECTNVLSAECTRCAPVPKRNLCPQGTNSSATPRKGATSNPCNIRDHQNEKSRPAATNKAPHEGKGLPFPRFAHKHDLERTREESAKNQNRKLQRHSFWELLRHRGWKHQFSKPEWAMSARRTGLLEVHPGPRRLDCPFRPLVGGRTHSALRAYVPPVWCASCTEN